MYVAKSSIGDTSKRKARRYINKVDIYTYMYMLLYIFM